MALVRLALCLIATLITADVARAGLFTVPVEPTPLPRQEVFSKNEAFVIVVDPKQDQSTIYAASDRSQSLWSIPGVLKSDVRRILLADSGSVVALISDGASANPEPSQVQGVRLIDREGRTRSYTISEFIQNPSFAYFCGPTSILWVDVVEDHGDRFTIRTTDGKQHTLEYTAAPRTGRWQKVVIAGVFCGVLIFFVRTVLRRRPAVEPAVVVPVETAVPA